MEEEGLAAVSSRRRGWQDVSEVRERKVSSRRCRDHNGRILFCRCERKEKRDTQH